MGSAARSQEEESPPAAKKRRGLRGLLAGGLLVAIVGVELVWWMANMPVVILMEDAPTGGFFAPERITVRVGTTVQWKNFGAQPHDATDDPRMALRAEDAAYPQGAKPFDSGFLLTGQSFSYTFEVPGIYKYVCLPHEFGGMTGEVIVTK